MKKLVALVIAFIVTLSLAGCASSSKADDVIRIGGLKGPTSIGMVKLMDDSANGSTKGKYEFTLAGSADELTPKLIQGELDVAAVPSNLASVLFNKTEGQIQLLAINTLGVIYIVDRNGEVKTVRDLNGKTIYSSGKGSTPEYSLRYILEQNGLDPDKDVNIVWKSEHSEVVQALASDESAIGLLPQPFVTVAKGKVEGLDIALDLTKEWEAFNNGSTMITGVLVVRKDFAENHKDALKIFLDEYKASVEYVNANVTEAAVLCEKFDIIKAAVAEKAIPYCNIVCISGEDMKQPINGYLQILYDANPQSIGGKMPTEDFYY